MIAHSPKETLVPLHLRLAGRFCIVVGAGAVGLRKCGNLLAAGAKVRLIDPGAAKLKNCHPGLPYRVSSTDSSGPSMVHTSFG